MVSLVRPGAKYLLIAAIQLLIVLIIAGCNKDISIYSNIHPDTGVTFIDDEQYYHEQKDTAEAIIGHSDLSELHTADRGKDISAYYSGNELCLCVADSSGNVENVYDIKNEIGVSYIDFAFGGPDRIFALAVDSSGNQLIFDISGDDITSCVGIESDYLFSAINAFDAGLLITGDHCVKKYDNSLNPCGIYTSDNTILGAAAGDDSVYIIETEQLQNEQTAGKNGYSYVYNLALKKLKLSDMTVREDKEICLYTDLETVLHHFGDADLIAADSDKMLLSLCTGVFQIDLRSSEAIPVVNTYDYGVISAPVFISCGTSLKLRSTYYDITKGGLVDTVTEIVPGTSEKKRINACILGECECEALFQYVNRNRCDYYICMNKAIAPGNDNSYIDILSGDPYDLVVFGEELRKPLIQGGYLLNLDSVGVDKTVLSSNLSDLMDYCIFPQYSVKAYFYDNALWNGDPASYLSAANDAKEIFANQTVRMLIEEYAGIVYRELETEGQLSKDTVLNLLELCDEYSVDYYESEPLINEISDGNVIYNSVEVGSLEQLYSLYCQYPEHFGYCAPLGFDSPAIVPEYYIGVYSGTAYSLECGEILNLLLDSRLQDYMSFPVNNDSLVSRIDGFISSIDKEYAEELISEFPVLSDSEAQEVADYYDRLIRDMTNGNHTEDAYPVFASYTVRPLYDSESLDSLRDVAGELISGSYEAYSADQELIDILSGEVNAYLSGAKDIDQAADVICSRVDLYYSQVGG